VRAPVVFACARLQSKGFGMRTLPKSLELRAPILTSISWVGFWNFQEYALNKTLSLGNFFLQGFGNEFWQHNFPGKKVAKEKFVSQPVGNEHSKVFRKDGIGAFGGA